jgi:uncharacterized protein YcbK (DUF882 family)
MFEDILSQNSEAAPQMKILERRDILKLGLTGLLAATVPLLMPGSARAANFSAYRVAFRHQHTGESFSGVYRVGDKYLPEAFERLNYVLRDFRTGEAFPMDPRVMDIIAALQIKTGGRPLEVLSGYRSPKTNAMLRKVSGGVARNSFHMYGQAMDIRMASLKTTKLRDAARSLRAGGVGYYKNSDFVHVDTGKIRSW